MSLEEILVGIEKDMRYLNAKERETWIYKSDWFKANGDRIERILDHIPDLLTYCRTLAQVVELLDKYHTHSLTCEVCVRRAMGEDIECAEELMLGEEKSKAFMAAVRLLRSGEVPK